MRSVLDSPNCPRCNREVETNAHAVMGCDSAKQIWESLGFTNLNVMSSMDMWDWFVEKIQNKQESTCRSILVAAWAIWSGRNKQVMEGKTISVYEANTKIRSMLRELDELKTSLPEHSHVPPVWWHPPDEEFVKLNFDTAFNGSSRRSCSSFVVRNSRSQIM